MTEYLQHPYAPWIFAALFFLLYVRQTIRLRRRRLEAEFMRSHVLPIGAGLCLAAGFFLGRRMTPALVTESPAHE